MKKIIFVETFSPKFDYSNQTVVALNGQSHYDLLKRNIKHKCISDFIDFKEFIKFTDEYNYVIKKFFNTCDQGYKKVNISKDISFAPFHTMPPITTLIFDSLFSSAFHISKIVKQLKPEEVLLQCSYRPNSKIINYSKKSKIRILYYDYLFYELVQYFSEVLNYKFRSEYVKFDRLELLKVWCYGKIKSNRFYNYYVQLKMFLKDTVKNDDLSLIEDNFRYLKDKNVLFINKGWGLDKLQKFVFKNNAISYYLAGDYLCTYEGSKLKRKSQLKIEKDDLKYKSIEMLHNTTPLCEFFNQTMGFSLESLLKNRLIYLKQKIIPSLYYKSVATNQLLIKKKIDFVIGNQKNNEWMYVLAYLGTYSNNCEFHFFQHGYNMYHVDRTFWELPCNVYYACNREYADYLKGDFANQDFFAKPQKTLVNPLSFYD